jgi:hypothetical protein
LAQLAGVICRENNFNFSPIKNKVWCLHMKSKPKKEGERTRARGLNPGDRAKSEN